LKSQAALPCENSGKQLQQAYAETISERGNAQTNRAADPTQRAQLSAECAKLCQPFAAQLAVRHSESIGRKTLAHT